MKKIFGNIAIFCLCAGAVFLVAAEQRVIGYSILGLGLLSLALAPRAYQKYLILIYPFILLMGVTPISTSIDPLHVLAMGIPGALAITIPYLVTRYVYQEKVITFQFSSGKKLTRRQIIYIILTFIISYTTIVFFLRSTGSYQNWDMRPDLMYLFIMFLGTNALGIWDEVFFINTVLRIFKKFLPFTLANFAQAFIFTSFLYELGFRGWGFIVIYLFALLQGYTLNKTHSLGFVITIHLIVDLMLFLALIHINLPTLPSIFPWQ